jgi:GDPmannose 4,6-dehydratase
MNRERCKRKILEQQGDGSAGVDAQVTLLNKTQPDEVYNLAAQSHVHTSFELPVYTAHVDGIGTLNCLEAIRQAGLAGKTKFYQVLSERTHSMRCK